jgi:hypothetical protein
MLVSQNRYLVLCSTAEVDVLRRVQANVPLHPPILIVTKIHTFRNYRKNRGVYRTVNQVLIDNLWLATKIHTAQSWLVRRKVSVNVITTTYRIGVSGAQGFNQW